MMTDGYWSHALDVATISPTNQDKTVPALIKRVHDFRRREELSRLGARVVSANCLMRYS